jgi:hypothetical protein
VSAKPEPEQPTKPESVQPGKPEPEQPTKDPEQPAAPALVPGSLEDLIAPVEGEKPLSNMTRFEGQISVQII